MKTDNIPALIMLIAGAVDCVLAIRNHLTLREFLVELLIVLLIFYFVGLLIRFVLKKYFFFEVEEEPEEEPEEEENEESMENIDIDDDNMTE